MDALAGAWRNRDFFHKVGKLSRLIDLEIGNVWLRLFFVISAGSVIVSGPM